MRRREEASEVRLGGLTYNNALHHGGQRQQAREVIAMSVNKVRASVGRWAGGERGRYATIRRGNGYITLRGIVRGIIALIALLASYAVVLNATRFGRTGVPTADSVAMPLVPLLLYVVGGYVAGVSAGHHQVVNASVVGVLLGMLVWFLLRLSTMVGYVDEQPLSAEAAGIGAGVDGIIARGWEVCLPPPASRAGRPDSAVVQSPNKQLERTAAARSTRSRRRRRSLRGRRTRRCRRGDVDPALFQRMPPLALT